MPMSTCSLRLSALEGAHACVDLPVLNLPVPLFLCQPASQCTHACAATGFLKYIGVPSIADSVGLLVDLGIPTSPVARSLPLRVGRSSSPHRRSMPRARPKSEEEAVWVA